VSLLVSFAILPRGGCLQALPKDEDRHIDDIEALQDQIRHMTLNNQKSVIQVRHVHSRQNYPYLAASAGQP
jgi:hypothetical protein